MLDLHCHILPDTDDGPTTLAESLELVRLAQDDGITDIIATPHNHRYLRLFRADILPRVASLNEEIGRAGLRVKIWPGAENQLFDPAIYRADTENGELCHLGDDAAFSLVEWPWDARKHFPNEVQMIEWIRAKGTRPILAHPERHAFFRDDLPRLDALVEAGAWVQLTASSPFGDHGPEPIDASAIMLRRYSDVVFATDSHSMDRRSGLREAYAWAEHEVGHAKAREIRERAAGTLAHIKSREIARGQM